MGDEQFSKTQQVWPHVDSLSKQCLALWPHAVRTIMLLAFLASGCPINFQEYRPSLITSLIVTYCHLVFGLLSPGPSSSSINKAQTALLLHTILIVPSSFSASHLQHHEFPEPHWQDCSLNHPPKLRRSILHLHSRSQGPSLSHFLLPRVGYVFPAVFFSS